MASKEHINGASTVTSYWSRVSGANGCFQIGNNSAILNSYYSVYSSLTSSIFLYTANGSITSQYDSCNSLFVNYFASSTGNGLLSLSYISLSGSATQIDPQITVTNYTQKPLQGGFAWTRGATSLTMQTNTGYIITSGAVTLTLPSTSNIGDTILVMLQAGTSWSIAQGTGQNIQMGDQITTTSTGSIASSSIGDSIKLVCAQANTLWMAYSTMGNLALT